MQRAVNMPSVTPRGGSTPYAPDPMTPEMSTTPPRTIGRPMSTLRGGRSPKTSHATSATTMTWRFPSTVARPAPTASTAWCHDSRSAAKNTPAIDREPHGAGRQRAVAPVLPPADEGEDREPVQAAEDRGRRWRDLRVPVEDAREGDEHRARERGQPRPAGDRPRGSPVAPGRRRPRSDQRSDRRLARLGRRRRFVPTKRRPSSASCSGSGADGASSMRSVPDCVFGNAMTSRMFDWFENRAAQRSMPNAIPPCGGAPYSNASRIAPNFSRMASSEWPWSAKLRSSRSRRQMRTEPPPSSQPFSTTSYCIARARPAGSFGEGRVGSPSAVTRSASSSGRTPENGLWVASQRSFSESHLYIGKR